MKTKKDVALAYMPIYKALFRTDGALSYEQVTEAIPALCDATRECGDVEDWIYIGEYTECPISDFLVGAYWHYTLWHGGQCSPSYAALCALGQIFSPGMSCEPEEGEPEWEAYGALEAMAKGGKQ